MFLSGDKDVIDFVKQDFEKLKIKDDNRLVHGIIAFADKKYLEALDLFITEEAALSRKFGRQSALLYQVILWKMLCYVQLGDKKQAKKALKEYKRYNVPVFPCATAEAMVENMKDSGHLGKVEILAKCSNLHCRKV